MDSEDSATYKLRNIKQDFPKFSNLFRTFCKVHDIPADKVFDVELSIEELVMNSFAHGDNSGKGGILVSIGLNDHELKVTVEDNAPPFNLLRHSKDVPSGPLEEREVGGLGIHLVKNLSDRIVYSGSKKGNKITIYKSLEKKGKNLKENHQRA